MQHLTFYLPLFFTLSRIIITPLILFFLTKNNVEGFLIGLILFLYALLSDFLDGFCARKYNAETALGRFLDPLADKLLLWPLLGYLYWIKLLALGFLLFFVLRDFLVTLLRIYAQKNNIIFTTSWWAKLKTTLQFCMIFTALSLLIAQNVPFHQLYIDGLLFVFRLFTALAFKCSLISAFLYLQPFQKKIELWGLYFICTAAGAGLIPFMPGTWGSLVGLISFAAVISLKTLVFLLPLLFILGTIASHTLCKQLQLTDPSFIVIDEVVGILFAAFLTMPKSLYQFTAIFVLFRFFDILKPWPIKIFEKLPGGLGIMADDLAAGFFAALLFKICVYIALLV